MNWRIYKRDVDILLAQELISPVKFLRRSKIFSDAGTWTSTQPTTQSPATGEADCKKAANGIQK